MNFGMVADSLTTGSVLRVVVGVVLLYGLRKMHLGRAVARWLQR